MNDYLDILRHEFEANDGSFLISMRVELEWDWEAFSRVTEAMRIYCDRHTESDVVERWVASGFYYLTDVTRPQRTKTNENGRVISITRSKCQPNAGRSGADESSCVTSVISVGP